MLPEFIFMLGYSINLFALITMIKANLCLLFFSLFFFHFSQVLFYLKKKLHCLIATSRSSLHGVVGMLGSG